MVLAAAEAALIMAGGVQAADRGPKVSPAGIRERAGVGLRPRKRRALAGLALGPLLQGLFMKTQAGAHVR